MKISISYPGHDREKDSQLETLATGLGGELLDWDSPSAVSAI